MIYRLLYLFLFTFLVISGCNEKSEYDQLIERELATGKVYNELFLEYELGMPKEEFYDHSWELNRKGLVMQGPQNQTVQYDLDNELPHKATMYYYPDFYDGKIFQMRVRFKYNGWAPWNKNLSSDNLQMDVVNLLKDWYGEGFIRFEGENNGSDKHHGYVKVDGNRRIVVTKLTDSEVLTVFTDLIRERKIEKQEK